jgi:hypothetical protein
MSEETDEQLSSPIFSDFTNTDDIDVRVSLQQCELGGLPFLLNYHYTEAKKSNNEKKQKKIQGLLEIHNHLLLKPDDNSAEYIGYIDFDIAHELYCGHQEQHIEKKDFRDILLHSKYGLCVYVANFLQFNKRYVILKTQTLDLPSFIADINNMFNRDIHDASTQAGKIRLDLDKAGLKRLLDSMDSEWDKKCAKVILAANRSRREIEELGLLPDAVVNNVKQVKNVIEKIEETDTAARETVLLRLHQRQENLKVKVDVCMSVIKQKVGRWHDYRINEIYEKLDVLKDQIQENETQINCLEKPDEANKYIKQKVRQKIKRTATELEDCNRIKKRKLGAGPKPLLDSSDEEFIAKAIEEKATYHGRRHKPVIFTNRRVKKRDLISIANYNLLQKGKKMIKSATTPWNRSRPQNKRSHQAKLHRGKGLFCTKKPPKAEDCDNENTHHQRSHCKNVREFLFSDPNTKEFAFMKSMDDKAYIRPGTSGTVL